MGAQGTAELDFGAWPGASDASVDVASAGVVATSLVEAFLRIVDTADHLADEHMIETIKVHAKYISDGNIRIYGFNTSQLNEPLEDVMKLNKTAASQWMPQDHRGIHQAGGCGTRLTGKWAIGWVWN